MHHTDADLDRLDALLQEQPPENDGMLLSEFDGFCAGLIVCPETIPPSDWVPLVWGEDAAPSFASPSAYRSALDLIMAHYNRVARSLMPPSSGYLPVLDIDPSSGETLWEPWVEGFEHAMALRPDAWMAIVDSGEEEAAASRRSDPTRGWPSSTAARRRRPPRSACCLPSTRSTPARRS
jgi:uncharacterized protein